MDGPNLCLSASSKRGLLSSLESSQVPISSWQVHCGFCGALWAWWWWWWFEDISLPNKVTTSVLIPISSFLLFKDIVFFQLSLEFSMIMHTFLQCPGCNSSDSEHLNSFKINGYSVFLLITIFNLTVSSCSLQLLHSNHKSHPTRPQVYWLHICLLALRNSAHQISHTEHSRHVGSKGHELYEPMSFWIFHWVV